MEVKSLGHQDSFASTCIYSFSVIATEKSEKKISWSFGDAQELSEPAEETIQNLANSSIWDNVPPKKVCI